MKLARNIIIITFEKFSIFNGAFEVINMMFLKRKNKGIKGLSISIFVSLAIIFSFNLRAEAEQVVNGPHADKTFFQGEVDKGECAVCHIPHYAKTGTWKKTWAREGVDDPNAPVRKLCLTCHDGTVTESVADFLQTFSLLETHVMHGAADINGDVVIPSKADPNFICRDFSCDVSDNDDFPSGAPEEYQRGGSFYCGTCHDVHREPANDPNYGDYLRMPRYNPLPDFPFKPGRRKAFCVQCHGDFHFVEWDCLECHHPHKGAKLIKDNERIGRLILRFDVMGESFKALPNVDITDPNTSIGQKQVYPSNFCFGCHSPQSSFWDETDNQEIKARKNDVVIDPNMHEHHPMGIYATRDSVRFRPAEGVEVLFNEKGEITCVSCHFATHGAYNDGPGNAENNKTNKFLRWSFNVGDDRDKADFCVACHSDKSESGLGEENKGHHQSYNESVNGRGNCMFCHFIHDGADRGDILIPELDALMRYPSRNLAWGDRIDDADTQDYEDLCFGCHGDPGIVQVGSFDALLDPNIFTHPFAIEDPNYIGAGFLTSGDAYDYYGDSASDRMYCGTCHDVHNNNTSPYLGNHPSPYNYDSENNLCIACHNSILQENFLERSHPIGVGTDPDGRITISGQFPEEFRSGGSGRPNGIVNIDGKIICLTCHNVHAAATSYTGAIHTVSGGNGGETGANHGKLLIMDNFPDNDTNSSDMLCRRCHAGGSNFPDSIGINGKHVDKLAYCNTAKGVCQGCHTPHNANAKRLWSCELTTDFNGVHNLCANCHNPGYDCEGMDAGCLYDSSDTIPGISNVFDNGRFENHVMFGGVNIRGCPENPVLNFGKIGRDSFPEDIFPLDANDMDTVPDANSTVSYCYRNGSYSERGSGFYCGTCHNPHYDPSDDPNDAYLRAADYDLIIDTEEWKRRAFCEQCHGGIHTTDNVKNRDCFECHHPHKGATLIKDNEETGRKILLFKTEEKTFIALPNVTQIDDSPGVDQYTSRYCYGCHNEDILKYAPMKVIHGDGDDPNVPSMEHHPMGTQASLTSGRFQLEGGINITLNSTDQLTCISCHDSKHGKGPFETPGENGPNKFLRWELKDEQGNDKIDFCIKCHWDKRAIAGEHLNPDNPNGRGGCMFCHFIHDGEERGSTLPPDPEIDSLMRFSARNLTNEAFSFDPNRYEALCFGCHFREDKVGEQGENGSLIVFANYFSHPYSSDVEIDSNRFDFFIDANNPYPVSDGIGMTVIDDYGTENGQIYCGTCHDVHGGDTAMPYLRGSKSPYKADGFCEYCHADDIVLGMSHPLNVKPDGRLTTDPFPDVFMTGGSGDPRGIIDGDKMICLTCHNVHAASTSYDGQTIKDSNPENNHGKLLVTDNFSNINGSGDELCKVCHKGSNFPSGGISGDHLEELRARISINKNDSAPDGICQVCHAPHRARYESRLWAIDLEGVGDTFDGVHELCYGCHNSVNMPYGLTITSGINTVFSRGKYENHVMLGGAETEIGACPEMPVLDIINWLEGPFPLDENDRDTIPDANVSYCGRNQSYKEGGSGFYCGSCHNPHKDLSSQRDGDYLRAENADDIGTPGNRGPFCAQCHGGFMQGHAPDTDCLKCHHPHKGSRLISDATTTWEERLGRFILVTGFNIDPNGFIALPNVPERDISGVSPDVAYSSGFCYGCHNESNTKFIAYDIGVISQNEEHHPMGSEARLGDQMSTVDGRFKRAYGCGDALLNNNGELTCTSCHDGMHGAGPFQDPNTKKHKARLNKYLRWELNNVDGYDKAAFCVQVCHNDKTVESLGTANIGHRQSYDDDRNRRGNCLFCHFIHDGEERGDMMPQEGIPPQLDTLMRYPAKNLDWGERINETDPNDYEDLCFGCHGKTDMGGIVDDFDAWLYPNAYFSHRFAKDNPTHIGEGFQISDGLNLSPYDDYGTKSGQIYCGTCHDVHNNDTSPYLGNHPSAYTDNSNENLCIACHDSREEENFLEGSHPIGVGPNKKTTIKFIDGTIRYSPTNEEFNDYYHDGNAIFSWGGSGRPGGILDDGKVICLTCHNVHAAVTSYEGKTRSDNRCDHGVLLVKDNYLIRSGDSQGSELCKSCHAFGRGEYTFSNAFHLVYNAVDTPNVNCSDYSDSNIRHKKGICSLCHTPHGALYTKLWNINSWQNSEYESRFEGVRKLCFSCHSDITIASTGRGNVFNLTKFEDHVMRGCADIDNIIDSNNRFYRDNLIRLFPVDPGDEDTIPRNYCSTGSDGFYCGSCHNVHCENVKGDKFLRYYDRSNLFCRQCHATIPQNIFHIAGLACSTCHHPHEGAVLIDNDPNVGRLILIDPNILLLEQSSYSFRAKPNVIGFSGSDLSSGCYLCHGPQNRSVWSASGATIIYGDTDGNSTAWIPKDHHPMGKLARHGLSFNAPGADRSVFNENGELTCTSCHVLHNFSNENSEENNVLRQNNYLRWDFTKDSSHFCLRCHSDKQEALLGPPGMLHHQTRDTSPVFRAVSERSGEANVRCGNCMLCHFIHDGEDLGDEMIPATEALMRVQPVNYRASDAWQDEDNYDYEDMCYGCHSNSSIVRGPGGEGSLLTASIDYGTGVQNSPSPRFSHRFRAAPNPTSTTSLRLSTNELFPISDGKGFKVLDDYGAQEGRMFCGTCHDVHNWGGNPMGNPGTKYLRGRSSPYVPGGFCNECHSADPAPSIYTPLLNHRLAPGPNPLVSVPEWPPILFENLNLTVAPSIIRGNGTIGGLISVQGGVTPNLGQMTCLTCHNIHAAATSFDGHVDHPYSNEQLFVDGRRGKLLVIDNGHGPAGSDLCIICHPDYSQVVGSPHDFSHRGLDGLGAGIADKGVCSACHRPHMAQNEKLLWARLLVEEKTMFGALPGFALGSTIFCYDCHSGIWCDANPPPELFLPFPPQDIAFVDGPGGMIAGYYEPVPDSVQDIPPYRIPKGMPTEIKTSGHYIRQPIITSGITQNNKMPCNDCHNPHRGITIDGVPNQAFIKAILGGKPIGAYKASINMAYHPEIRDNLASRQACVNCHGLAERSQGPIYPPSAFTDVNPLYMSILPVSRPTQTVYEHFDMGLYACTDCHRHNRAMVLCTDCHAYPPLTAGDGWSGIGDQDENYKGGAGAHEKHVIDHQFPCTMCHLGCLHDPGGATVVNPLFKRSKVSIDFDMSYKFPRTTGEFRTQMGYAASNGNPEIPPIYNPSQQTCKVGCHNPLIGDPDEPSNLDNWTPPWSLYPPQTPTPPTYPYVNIPESFITIRIPYPVPMTVPGPWIIPPM